MSISSPAFTDGGEIETRYTCQGEDVSPELVFAGVTAGAKSLVLIVVDPDAPTKPWVHWLLYNLPSQSTGLPQALSQLPGGTMEGRNSWKRTGYGGPCPPVGRHRYIFTLYALDVLLPDLGEPEAAALLAAMQGHLLARSRMIATYQKHE